MAKRDRSGDAGEGEGEGEGDRPQKRQRSEHQQLQTQEIHFARQLQDFLVFRQDGVQQLRNGIASFKLFLESILYHKEEENRGRQISILREYLETQKPADAADLDRPFLSQLWQAWSFANQNNNDYLASSVSAVLALLLKTISGLLDLREHGLLLCRTVLQSQHLRLAKRGLEAPKHKDFVISPSLRLLTEVASFDGGVLTRELYKRREQTFDVRTMRRLLGLVKLNLPDEEAKRKPAVRTLALRYVLSLFKYLHEGGKNDIVKDKPLCGALFQHIQDDPSDLVSELLNAVEQHVLKDDAVSRSAKSTLLTSHNLERVTKIAAQSADDHHAANNAFDWLERVCTTSSYGILRTSGWYPPGTTKGNSTRRDFIIDLGLENLEFYDRDEPINVRNTTLLSWALTLRAHTNERERELLLSCLKAAPELVAPYFGEKTTQLDPKLSNTWIGYASLLFEVVNLPLPDHLGAGEDWAVLPPQTSIMVENLLPRPLTQKVLTRCLNHSSDLISFFATRILVKALEKLQLVLNQLQRAALDHTPDIWREAIDRLVQRFTERAPAIREVISAFRRLPDDEQHVLQREACTRLLSLYHQVLSQPALEEHFDVSVALNAALSRKEAAERSESLDTQSLWTLELEHLLNIAQHSSGMKWFNKQGGLTYTPVVTLLRMYSKDLQWTQMRRLVEDVLTEHGILNRTQDAEPPSPLDALLASLMEIAPDDKVMWNFVDDCMQRATRKPVKYIDDFEEISGVDSAVPSLITAVLMEQASFVAADWHGSGQSKGRWVNIFLQLLIKTSDNNRTLNKVIEQIRTLPGWASCDDGPTNLLPKVQVVAKGVATGARDERSRDHNNGAILPYEQPPREATRHPELSRWSQKDVDLAIEDGDIGALFLDLCSREKDIRRQALTQLNKLKLQLRSENTYENSAQLSLLVGELTETFEQHYLPADVALPYLAGTFAIRALQVQTQPQHFIYPKLNKFLIRGPEWRVGKMPGYWLSNTILSSPEEDDAYWKEVQWVLDWLVDGLRASEDLDILRRGEVFEKVMALWSSPGAASHKQIRERIFELVYRATCIDGGSNTVVTRAGALSWLDMTAQLGDARSTALRTRVREACDQERLLAWAGLAVA